MDSLAPVTPSPTPAGVRATARTSTLARSAGAGPNPTLPSLCQCYGAEPVELVRTRDGRTLSGVRCRGAEEFMPSFTPDAPGGLPDVLYFAGITAQLALSSHLLDVGFPEDWCARHVGYQVSRSLAYANATGFGYECAETARLAQVLSPYWKWNKRSLFDNPCPDDGGFIAPEIEAILLNLMEHVYHVTGHTPSRPREGQT